jgi:hypothetical protein
MNFVTEASKTTLKVSPFGPSPASKPSSELNWQGVHIPWRDRRNVPGLPRTQAPSLHQASHARYDEAVDFFGPATTWQGS